MTLMDSILSLSEKIKKAIGVEKKPSTVDMLTDRIEAGSKMITLINHPGHQAVNAECQAQETVLMERFLADDDTAVKTWEQFIELRGFIRGLRARRQMPVQILRAGAQAEQELQAIQKARRQ